MGTLIDGKVIAKKIDAQTKILVEELKNTGKTARLDVVLVGDDESSLMYDRMKGAAAERLGLDFELHHFPSSISEIELIKKIHDIQKNKKPNGLILQLPLPEHLYKPEVLNSIDPKIDVDFLTNERLGTLVMDTNTLLPPTPGAVFSILEDLNVDLSGKNVTIIGMGALVGKPLAIMLINAKASVTTINSRTKNVKEKCLSADIIITGVGKKDILRGDMVRENAIVIDTGISFENEKVYGDVKVDEALKKASFVTPTPGGVGPITVARLLLNTALSAEMEIKDTL
jgi:methylenetetrahydrofolate dehydrogenase (NADP+)/methenyltetrahydrofolate cyclohydrolase